MKRFSAKHARAKTRSATSCNNPVILLKKTQYRHVFRYASNMAPHISIKHLFHRRLLTHLILFIESVGMDKPVYAANIRQYTVVIAIKNYLRDAQQKHFSQSSSFCSFFVIFLTKYSRFKIHFPRCIWKKKRSNGKCVHANLFHNVSFSYFWCGQWK